MKCIVISPNSCHQAIVAIYKESNELRQEAIKSFIRKTLKLVPEALGINGNFYEELHKKNLLKKFYYEIRHEMYS